MELIRPDSKFLEKRKDWYDSFHAEDPQAADFAAAIYDEICRKRPRWLREFRKRNSLFLMH